MPPDPNAKITINGVQYSSIDEVPEQFRELIRDSMNEAVREASASISEPGAQTDEQGRKVIKKSFHVEKHFNLSLGNKPGPGPTSLPPGVPAPRVEAESSGWGLWLLLGAAVLIALSWALKH